MRIRGKVRTNLDRLIYLTHICKKLPLVLSRHAVLPGGYGAAGKGMDRIAEVEAKGWKGWSRSAAQP